MKSNSKTVAKTAKARSNRPSTDPTAPKPKVPDTVPAFRSPAEGHEPGALVTRPNATARDGAAAKVTPTPLGLRVIEAMAAEGQDQRSIAAALGVDQKTIRYMRDRDPARTTAAFLGLSLAIPATPSIKKAALPPVTAHLAPPSLLQAPSACQETA